MKEQIASKANFLNAVPATFFFTDVHARILFATRRAEFFFGYDRGEIEDQRIGILFLEEDQVYLLPNIVYLTRYKEGFNGEALLKQKDGKRIFAHISTTSFKEDGQVFLAFAFQEIQRLKTLERERAEMERWACLGRMMKEVAHQMRSPIVSIGGYANRLSKSAPPSPQGHPYLSQILKETKKLETALQHLEEYMGVPKPTVLKENIREVVQAAISPFSKEEKNRGISFHLDTTGLSGNSYLFIDRGLILKVLGEILKNSLDAVSWGSSLQGSNTIKVALVDDGERVGVTVADWGSGISERDLDQIYEPFFSTRPDRTGLGLTFVRRVMEEHGGKVQVESRLGKGTAVTLSFPKDRRRKIRREFIVSEATAG